MQCRDAPAERPRPAPGQALSRSLVALDQNSTIIAVVELSQSSWLVAGMLPGVERQPRQKLEPSPERLWHEDAPNGELPSDPFTQTSTRRSAMLCKKPHRSSSSLRVLRRQSLPLA